MELKSPGKLQILPIAAYYEYISVAAIFTYAVLLCAYEKMNTTRAIVEKLDMCLLFINDILISLKYF
jgi:hypothetical protein